MKRLFLAAALIMVSMVAAVAQQVEQLEQDKDVKVGKLDNGLTYYIRHNEKPAERASFYLVTNVGAIQETPAQDGLAHFLEHMCLNGTKNFPGKGIISYMESIGAKFGYNVNAATGVEQTAYMLMNVPLNRKTVVDSSILILHDYSHFVTNDPAEIDAERGVIIEEWRTRRDANQRGREALFSVLYKDSKYATCNIIGTKENLETFKPEELVNFYQTWYRPDLQAVIVVGDVDVDYVEGKIKEYFNQIPKAENPKAKDVIKIPDNKEPLVSIFTDKELNTTDVTLFIKSEPMPEAYNATNIGLLTSLMKDLITNMLGERLDDMSKSANAPFISASAGFGKLCETLEAFVLGVTTKDGEGLKGFEAALVELERAKKFGFTQDEYDRAKTNILKALENRKNNADSRQNEQFCRTYMSNFVDNEPYMTPEYEYNITKQYLDMLPVAAVNQTFGQVITSDNNVISYSAPAKEGVAVPTEKELTDALETAKNADIKPLESAVSNEPLMDASVLKGSKIKKEEKGEFGSTVFTLSNGIKVIVKPTDFKKDEIRIKTVAKGGTSFLPEELLPSMERNVFSVYESNSGISKFPQTQLNKMLTGKIASASYYIGTDRHGVNAYSSPNDLETAMQLLYLSYTEPRVEQQELEVGLSQLRALVPNLEKQPNFIFSVAIQQAIANSPRNVKINSDLLEKVNAENIKKALNILYGDAAGTTVIVTGNVDMNTFKPLMEKYIGSIPVKAKSGRDAIDYNMVPAKGFVDNTFDVAMETPKTSVAILYSAYDIKNNLENRVALNVLQGILDQLYTKTIREDEGGTYGVSVQAMAMGSKDIKDCAILAMIFDTDYAKSLKLIKLAKDGLKNIAVEGPNEGYLAKTKENLLKNFPENQIQNGYWESVLNSYYVEGVDNFTTYTDVVNSVNAQTIKALVEKILSAGNETDVIMNPAEK